MHEKQLYDKFSKCEFWLNKVAFLGYMVFKEGVFVDLKKIKVVAAWEKSMNVTEVISFLGLAEYY